MSASTSFMTRADPRSEASSLLSRLAGSCAAPKDTRLGRPKNRRRRKKGRKALRVPTLVGWVQSTDFSRRVRKQLERNGRLKSVLKTRLEGDLRWQRSR